MCRIEFYSENYNAFKIDFRKKKIIIYGNTIVVRTKKIDRLHIDSFSLYSLMYKREREKKGKNHSSSYIALSFRN